MENVRSHGSTVHSLGRELIQRIVECCDQEAQDKTLLVSINKATNRAAKYCKVSQRTIKRIRKEGKLTTTGEKLSTPDKKRKRPDSLNAVVDDFDRRVILDVVRDSYINKKIFPTCGKMLPVLRKRIQFKWGEWTLRRILKEMGFKCKKCKSKKEDFSGKGRYCKLEMYIPSKNKKVQG
uniref:Uncharacterized protein n=1 Tax=Clastoptera arizonana TaxID=38151 RepID=A0A1B6EAJ4_9HEMI